MESSSNSQLILAVSHWLQQSIPAEEEEDDPAGTSEIAQNSSEMSAPIPMVYSHEHWFDSAIGPICEEIGVQLDVGHEEGAKICRLLSFALELSRRVPKGHCARERMAEMMTPLKQLLRCSEKPALEQNRRLAQQALCTLLDRFEPAAQFLLISRLFQLVFAREIRLSEEIYEPQVLAFLVDIFRQKCFGGPNKESKQIFQSQLANFYARLQEIVYEDPLISLNFYAAVLLLIGAQALHRVQIPLLSGVGQPMVDKFRRQLRDWMELRRMRRENQAANSSQNGAQFLAGQSPATMAEMLEGKMAAEREEEDAGRLAMFSLQLEEAERRVASAIGGGK